MSTVDHNEVLAQQHGRRMRDQIENHQQQKKTIKIILTFFNEVEPRHRLSTLQSPHMHTGTQQNTLYTDEMMRDAIRFDSLEPF